MSLARRIGAALAANAFGQAVTVFAQLVLTPLYVLQWGATLYGEWLLLAAIPAYLAIADVGLGSAAGNEMTMRVGAGDAAGAQRTYRGALVIAAGASAIALALAALLAAALLLAEPFGLQALSAGDAAAIVLLLAAYIGLTFFNSVAYNGLRSCGRNALGLMLGNSGRLVEALVAAIALAAGAAPLVIATAQVALASLTLIVKLAVLRSVCPWLRSPRSAPDLQLLRRLIRPALGFAALPAANALLLQGPILIIAATLGGAAVTLFATTRTLARLPIQLTNMLNASVWPEMSRAYGAGDAALMRRLHRISLAVASAFNLMLFAVLLVGGEALYRLWLGEQVDYSAGLMLALAFVTLLSAPWNTSSIVLAATNRHGGFGALSLLCGAASVVLAAALVPRYGVVGACIPLVLFELVVGAYVMRQATALSGDTPAGAITAALRAPWRVASVARERMRWVGRP